MKRKLLFPLLGLETLALLALVLMTDKFPKIFSSLLAFPFEQLGAGLRALSLTGRIGNGLALALWICISLLPALPVWQHRGDRSRAFENAALYLCSALLLFALYAFANPALLYAAAHGAGEAAFPVMKAIVGGTVWSGAVLFVILRLLRLFRSGSTAKLFNYMRALLFALCALFAGVIALSCGGELIASLRGAQQFADGAVSVIRFLVSALPYALNIAISVSAVSLLDALAPDAEDDAAKLAEKLSRLCCRALGITAASATLFNILQIALAQRLSNVEASLNIPVMSIAFVLAVLLVSRLIAENRRLKSDNDLFI